MTQTLPGRALLRSGEFKVGALLIAAAAFYRPLVLWSANAWDISAPERLLAIGAVIFGLALVPYVLLTRIGVRSGASALGIAGALYIALNWHHLQPHPLYWVGLIAVISIAGHMKFRDEVTRWISYIAIATLTVAPLAQLVITHVRSSESYPIIETVGEMSGTATGLVEDVVIVVVDSYPSLALAESWFSHDTIEFQQDLRELGFTVETAGWSQHTFTGLAVPSLLELQPVAEAGPKGNWGNHLSVYGIIRGDNFVANSLRSAGYQYTHVESGWDGGSCGPVDTCLGSTWLDEVMWELLRPSVAANLLVQRYGHHSVGNSLNVVKHLKANSQIFDDGRRDYVYAHLLLPHDPLVVDENCDLSVDDTTGPTYFAIGGDTSGVIAPLVAQLSCVDRLIVEIAQLAGPKSAMVITGDHGTWSGGQLGVPPEKWSDADIGERLGVFLAYRLPESCAEPSTSVNTDVVRAIMVCAVEIDIPQRNGVFLIGAEAPVYVDPARMRRIETSILDGTLLPNK